MTQEATAERPTRQKRAARAERPSGAREPLADPPQVADYLGLTEKALENWRYREVGPRFIRVGQSVRYRWSDIDAWLEMNTPYPPSARPGDAA